VGRFDLRTVEHSHRAPPVAAFPDLPLPPARSRKTKGGLDLALLGTTAPGRWRAASPPGTQPRERTLPRLELPAAQPGNRNEPQNVLWRLERADPGPPTRTDRRLTLPLLPTQAQGPPPPQFASTSARK